jgi:hypothetical protein
MSAVAPHCSGLVCVGTVTAPSGEIDIERQGISLLGGVFACILAYSPNRPQKRFAHPSSL